MAFSKLYDKYWFKKPFPNMRAIYKKKLYDDWYNSLTDEQKEWLRQKEEREKKEHEERMMGLLRAYDKILSKCGGDYFFDRFNRIFR